MATGYGCEIRSAIVLRLSFTWAKAAPVMLRCGPSHSPGRGLLGRLPMGRPTRRAISAGIAAALAPRPLVAQARSPDGMRHLGVLMGGLDDPDGQTRAAALVQGLGALNWRDGKNLRINWRWAGGAPALYERYAAELIELDPEVLVAWGSPSVAALRRQSSTAPIVIVNVTDPVGQGFAESLARPGGNITGFTDYDPRWPANGWGC